MSIINRCSMRCSLRPTWPCTHRATVSFCCHLPLFAIEVLSIEGANRFVFCCYLSLFVMLFLNACKVFSANFNIMTALVAHQSPTLPQKIDSREGLFSCNKGVVVNVGKMNIYFRRPPFAPILGLFAAKYHAICC